jgi:hypothetical protein
LTPSSWLGLSTGRDIGITYRVVDGVVHDMDAALFDLHGALVVAADGGHDDESCFVL